MINLAAMRQHLGHEPLQTDVGKTDGRHRGCQILIGNSLPQIRPQTRCTRFCCFGRFELTNQMLRLRYLLRRHPTLVLMRFCLASATSNDEAKSNHLYAST